MTPSDGASIASKTLLGLIQGSRRPDGGNRAGAEHSNHLWRIASADPGRGGSAGGVRGEPWRPRRHRASQRPPNIVTFLAASVAGTAAPLNPAYKEDEFRFYLDDTNAKVLLLPPDGVDEARAAAGDAPVLTVEMDATGTVTVRGVTGRSPLRRQASTTSR